MEDHEPLSPSSTMRPGGRTHPSPSFYSAVAHYCGRRRRGPVKLCCFVVPILLVMLPILLCLYAPAADTGAQRWPYLPFSLTATPAFDYSATTNTLHSIVDSEYSSGYKSAVNATAADGSSVLGTPLPPSTSVLADDIILTTQTHVTLSLERLEMGLAVARSAIRRSILEANRSSRAADADYVPRGPAYRNPRAFHRSYLEMERLFRVYVYEHGEPPLFHDGPCRSIYSTEGRFIYNMEMETRLRTKDPDKAHVYFLPFSIAKMVTYNRIGFNINPIHRTIRDYIRLVSERYPYWNRSEGADHFVISCHDWAPNSTKAVSHLYSNSIRVLCNANTSEGFNPMKDVSLPEMNLKKHNTTEIIMSRPPGTKRPLLAFFAGRYHGRIRKVLFKHWLGKDVDVQVYQSLPRKLLYYDMMRQSKYCLCPSGWEVASPRVVEAIYFECVPVIISQHYILPFSDILNWSAFSVSVDVEDIPNLKNILMSIPDSQYRKMKKLLKVVQKHFVVRTPPQRFDMYHMILHSVWLRRLNIRIRS